ncbi:MAG TPA: hypothetical protein PLF20_10025, partial [Bacteroidales bacterium]|nr:hypothetical protein [Bacteroidales bacterium]
MMKWIVLFLPILFYNLHCEGQKKQAAVWIYGDYNKLDFNFSPMKVSRTNASGWVGAASICDSNGVLQFFANGTSIINWQSLQLVNFEQQYPQYGPGYYGCNIIIPFQSNPNLYQYFSVRGPLGNPARYRLFRFIVDMRLNGGSGGFDNSQTKEVKDWVGTQLACLIHTNGKDTWLVARHWRSDSLVSLLVVDTGIVKAVYSKTGSPAAVPNIEGTGLVSTYDSQLKSSPNSELLLNPRRRKEFPYHELYRFNRDSGTLSKPLYIHDTIKASQFYINDFPDGAFSPDSRLLYVSTGTRNKPLNENDGPGHFWQYSLENYDSLAIAQSRIYLGLLGRGVPSKPEPWPFSPKFQLGMDGKIYISPGIPYVDSLLSIIHCPNNRGSNCQLKFREINLKKGRNAAYFPTLNQT